MSVVSQVPSIVLDYCSSNGDSEHKSTRTSTSSSTDTSLASSPCGDLDVIEKYNELYEEDVENFMKDYVARLFNPAIEITISKKHTFGQLCQEGHGREMFAKFVNMQRCESQRVDESTFYKLTHSFALVLFECYDADDFIPCKTLMNMAFTYYHVPELSSRTAFTQAGEIVELKSPDSEFVENYAHELSGGSDNENTETRDNSLTKKTKKPKKKVKSGKNPSIWKTANIWVNREIKLIKDSFYANDDSEQSNTLRSDGENNTTENENNNIKSKQAGTRVYLYDALKNQVIWKSLRFWNAAFFDAVNVERQHHCSEIGWNDLTPEERENANEVICNVTFGQLGTFINNMKYLGIGQKTCLEFLRKQCIIGNLNKELYHTLKCQVETPLPPDS